MSKKSMFNRKIHNKETEDREGPTINAKRNTKTEKGTIIEITVKNEHPKMNIIKTSTLANMRKL